MPPWQRYAVAIQRFEILKEEIEMPIQTRSLVRSTAQIHRASEPSPVLEITIQPDETVDQACLRVKKAEQERLEATFGKPTRSTDVKDF